MNRSSTGWNCGHTKIAQNVDFVWLGAPVPARNKCDKAINLRYNNWFLAESEYNGILLFNFVDFLYFSLFVPAGVIEYSTKARRYIIRRWRCKLYARCGCLKGCWLSMAHAHVQTSILYSIYTDTTTTNMCQALPSEDEKKNETAITTTPRNSFLHCITQRALYYHLSQYSYQMRNAFFFVFIFAFLFNIIIRHSPLFHDNQPRNKWKEFKLSFRVYIYL